jgi:hypothetical protein
MTRLLIRGRDEHYKRSPDCAFFYLINQHEQPAVAKKTTSKKGRQSKASRLSTQSNLTVLSEGNSISDLPAEEDDSVLTTGTNVSMASQPAKKGPKGKKAVATKGRKTKAKKEEPVEVEPIPEPEDADFEVKTDKIPEPKAGRKRGSDQMEVETKPGPLAPPKKRRATRTRASIALDADESAVQIDSVQSVGVDNEEETSELPAPARKRGRPSGSKSTRKTRQSAASEIAPPSDLPGDDELDQALQADLERPLTDEEDNLEKSQDIIPKNRRTSRAAAAAAPKRATRASMTAKSSLAMFDTEAVVVDESAIEAELDAMEIDSKPLPKAKAAKGKQARKPSAKQETAARKAQAAAEAEAEAKAQTQAKAEVSHLDSVQHEMDLDAARVEETIAPKGRKTTKRAEVKATTTRKTRASISSMNEGNTSIMSDQSISRSEARDKDGVDADTSIASQSKSRKAPARSKKGGKKEAEISILEEVEATAVQVGNGEAGDTILQEPVHAKPVPPMEPQVEPQVIVNAEKASKAKGTKGKGKAKVDQPPPILPPSRPQSVILPPVKAKANTSTKIQPAATQAPQPRSPTPPTKESTPSTAQSSDAENHPPSSKPSTTKQSQSTPKYDERIVSTPTTSPPKQNMVSQLSTTQPWVPIDLETIFLKSPSREDGANSIAIGEIGRGLERISKGEQALTSAEKNMSVEEWIRFNAGLAEERLRAECERMVGKFERQGGRAMQALEEVECME